MYETTPDDFLRLTGSEDSTPVHGVNITVARMQGLPFRANEEDIVRKMWRGEGVWVWGWEEMRCEGWKVGLCDGGGLREW